MTKKHFEAMATYVAELRRTASGFVPGNTIESEAKGAYELALYLCNTFGARFDRARFDAWIEKRANKGA